MAVFRGTGANPEMEISDVTDHITSLLETAVVFLVLTNAVTAAAAIAAVRLLSLRANVKCTPTAIERKFNLLLVSTAESPETGPVSPSVDIKGCWQ
jgi:hypothetical protein